MFLQGTLQQDGNLIQSSRINTILLASRIRQYDIGLRPELSDGSLTVECHLNCVPKYVSPSTVSKLAKSVNDCEQLDDPKAGDKRLRSSAGGVFDLNKHCLFYHYITTCKLSMIPRCHTSMECLLLLLLLTRWLIVRLTNTTCQSEAWI